MNIFSRGVLLAAWVASSPALAAEAAYPDKPIRMIAPSSVGGPVDVIARMVAQGLAESLGQQIVVDNRAGAAGLIGAELVAHAAPDGYTLLFGFSGPLVIVPHLGQKTPYNTLKDFTPISLAAAGPYVLIVHPNTPATSVKELVALAKARPGKLNFASGGNGTGIHMAGELFKLAAGINIVHVPYKGAGPGMTALLGGEVDMMFNGLTPAIPHIAAKRVRALAVGGAKRAQLLPDVPTVGESGLAFNTTGWYGVLGPPQMPRNIVGKLHREIVRTLHTPEMKDRFARQGIEPVGSSPEEFAALIREEWGKWDRVIKAAGLREKQG